MVWKAFNWQSQKVGQKGEVLKRNTYRCGFCMGKGIIPGTRATRCPGCSGAGTVTVPGCVVICAYCSGKGRSHLNRGLACGVCGGKGVVPIESNDIGSCPVCKGTGRERSSSLPCLACGGKGVVSKRRITSEDTTTEDELFRSDCPNRVKKGVPSDKQETS